VTEQEWTFAMIDLAGFTALTDSHGDAEAADLATGFTDLARTSLADGDQLVKSIGDAVLLASPTPAGGIELVRRILNRCSERKGYLATRTGIHAGPAAARGDDFFGSAVNLTARLASHASGGQVLATGAVATAAGSLGLTSRELGHVEFKNVATAVEVHELDLGVHVESTESIDPVCRMRVAHHQAAGFLRHEGVDHWFCSLACAHTFTAAHGGARD